MGPYGDLPRWRCYFCLEQGSSSENGPSSQAINNLSGVTITNANLTASEIPANIVLEGTVTGAGNTATSTSPAQTSTTTPTVTAASST
ncbi:MAG TPA: hypothetical protein VGL31_17315, partial [Xanthobacteraceae bacterium]